VLIEANLFLNVSNSVYVSILIIHTLFFLKFHFKIFTFIRNIGIKYKLQILLIASNKLNFINKITSKINDNFT